MAAKIVGAAPADEVSRRVAELDDGLAAKPANVGLIGAREQATDEGTNGRTLGTFLNAYITGRTDVKIRTTINLDQARKNLVAYFGEAKPLAEITEGDAEDFRRSLLTRLAINTARRHCGRAKQFFAGAVRKRYLTRNPFAELRGVGVKGNPEKLYFVTRGEAQQVLDACPDNQWRLLFALARFGGLRTPSEPLLLKWTDIDWHRGRIRVTSPRTEHHDGKSERIIPLFPELRPILEAAWDEAPEGTEFVITRCRDTNQNLRTQLQRIIAKAGLKGWPKLFHNLRATRETELAGQHPVHVVCDWIGNSQLIAAKHDLSVSDDDFTKAIGETAKPTRIPTQQPSARLGNAPHVMLARNEATPVLQGFLNRCNSLPKRDCPHLDSNQEPND